MTTFKPQELAADAKPIILTEDTKCNGDAASWRPLFRHPCSFNPDIFNDVLVNLIRNPNINSSWLFRADILSDAAASQTCSAPTGTESLPAAPIPRFVGFELRRCIIRKLIPRNTLRDKPLDQTCLIYGTAPFPKPDEGSVEKTLVVYLPHVSAASEMPFYHPIVRGIAFLHEWNAAESCGAISISYLFFSDEDRSSVRLTRTAFHLLEVVHKHGKGRLEGYRKRVHHDQLLPQARVQNTYTRLKQKYARGLIEGWVETTDPEKHVFEDLCIAAFLIELWADMYGQGTFPGFVDIGCGNGLLVHILNQEGFTGWGFDARSRKSWAAYNTKLKTSAGEQDTLRQLVLLPPPVSRDGFAGASDHAFSEELVHDGRFPRGTFIISNHADELTPWTPIIAAVSECPFIAIPCCSHNLAGERFRAPAPKDKTKADSAYSSLVVWVTAIAEDCGWEVEQEMLRIPSTRNTALVGRRRSSRSSPLDIQAVVDRYGGAAGYLESVIKLVASTTANEH
ncbi:0305dc49-c428-4b3f-b47a-950fe42f67f5 [Thermothielavioides terrestris]|uniref:tRNA (uracil-O(2)-)-methyltransferase n=1 Tax=Thermothielavioides terrestris TaxID=2587410 RepID=A0A3S4EYU6_9PEZI|nr:0305dc49-c428-4b3f-b47a-950fe42f67f5 [Thermothielavioides terrestris]